MIALATGKVIKIPPPRTVKPKNKGTMRKHHSCKSEIGHVKNILQVQSDEVTCLPLATNIILLGVAVTVVVQK